MVHVDSYQQQTILINLVVGKSLILANNTQNRHKQRMELLLDLQNIEIIKSFMEPFVHTCSVSNLL